MKKASLIQWPILLIVLIGLSCAGTTAAQTYLCVKKKKWDNKGKASVVAKNTPCGAKQTDLSAGTKGDKGDAGNDGEDGQLRIYGDGSAGALSISEDTTLNETDHLNLQYTDVTVDAGATLTVPSGTVIRCTGTFTNNGTIAVQVAAKGGRRRGGSGDPTEELQDATSPPHPGVSTGPAMNGEVGHQNSRRYGGRGGVGLTEFEARQVLLPGTNAGAGGGVGGPSTGSAIETGSDGGGSLVVICQGAIVNTAQISANGEDAGTNGGGGGAGGVLIFTSLASITNSAAGVISADGGDGEASDADEGASGGGGGGIVHFLAPAITIANEPSVTADGGTAGDNSTDVTDVTAQAGGGGGGACGGDGGNAGNAEAGAAVPTAASNGGDGYVLQSPVDPSALF